MHEPRDQGAWFGKAVLVTGATGFIGRRLTAALLRAGATVTAMVRGDAHPAGCRIIRPASFTPQDIKRALKTTKFDAVFNLVAYGVAPGDREAEQAVQINIDAATAIAEAAAHCGAAVLVHTGSCAEYAVRPHALRESDPLESEKLYGRTKAAGTAAVAAIARKKQMPCVAVRVFGVYGPGEAAHRLLPNLVRYLSAGQRVPLTPGAQLRDFLHVDDAATGLMALASEAPAAENPLVNLCSGVGVSVRAFAEETARVMGCPSSLLGFGDTPYRPDDVMVLVGDTTKLHATTAWRPVHSLTSGIAASLAELGIAPR